MKKILFLAATLMLGLTTLTAQITTTTINTISDFSDFTIGGTADNGINVKTTQSPLTFTIGYVGSHKDLSNIYISTTQFDSIVAEFYLYASASFKYNGVYENQTGIKKHMMVSNTNSISVSFTLSCFSPSSTDYISVRNLSVVGYKNGAPAGIKESLDLNKTNVWVNSNKIFFKNLDNKKLNMKVFNMAGQLVMEDANPKPETEINLETGVYTIQLTEDNKVIYNKKVQITP